MSRRAEGERDERIGERRKKEKKREWEYRQRE